MKHILLIVIAVMTLSCSKVKKVTPVELPEPKLNPVFFGVNLAGAEFGLVTGAYGAAYVYPNNAELDYYKSKGLKMIRLPFRWERMQPEMNAELNSAELSRLMAFADAAKERGLFIIPDCHNFGRRTVGGTGYLIGSAQVPIAAFRDFWTKMAIAFKSRTNIWAYDIMNEPHDMLPAPARWFDIAQEAIYGIRSVDVTGNIMISGDAWSGAPNYGVPGSTSEILKNLIDPSNKLVYQAHVYFDNDASGSYDATYDTEGGTPTKGVERVKPFVDWLNANNKKGFVGEYGVPANDARWLVTLDNFLAYLKANCVNGTYWAGGPWWGTYPLSIEPAAGADKPQIEVVKRYPEYNCL